MGDISNIPNIPPSFAQGIQIASGLSMGAVEGYTSYKEASVNYKLAQAQQTEHNRRVTDTLLTTYRGLEEDADQVQQNAISASIDQQKLSAQLKGQALVESAGTGGSAVNMVQRDVEMEASRNTAKRGIMTERQMGQIRTQATMAETRAENSYNLMPIQSPSRMSYVVGAGTSAFRNILSSQQLQTQAEGM